MNEKIAEQEVLAQGSCWAGRWKPSHRMSGQEYQWTEGAGAGESPHRM